METYSLATPGGQAIFQPGSQCVRWEGVNIWLGFAPRYLQGQPHVHAMDMHKTLDPLLAPTPPPTAGRVIVVDPGHGGADGGTQGNKQQIEKHLAMDWALRLRPLLQSNGWVVHLTRTNDSDVSLSNRVAQADCVAASLFLSLHFNGLSTDARHSGIEVFCTTPRGLPSSVKRNGEDNLEADFPNNGFDPQNLRYAVRLQRELVAATQAADGGVRRARFMAVLRGQSRPAVLIEGGFLSNPQEAQRVASPAYRQTLATAVARAVGRPPAEN
jgi:N-acetylmuramoyl-L-alanine amidase